MSAAGGSSLRSPLVGSSQRCCAWRFWPLGSCAQPTRRIEPRLLFCSSSNRPMELYSPRSMRFPSSCMRRLRMMSSRRPSSSPIRARLPMSPIAAVCAPAWRRFRASRRLCKSRSYGRPMCPQPACGRVGAMPQLERTLLTSQATGLNGAVVKAAPVTITVVDATLDIVVRPDGTVVLTIPQGSVVPGKSCWKPAPISAPGDVWLLVPG